MSATTSHSPSEGFTVGPFGWRLESRARDRRAEEDSDEAADDADPGDRLAESAALIERLQLEMIHLRDLIGRSIQVIELQNRQLAEHGLKPVDPPAPPGRAEGVRPGSGFAQAWTAQTADADEDEGTFDEFVNLRE